MYVTLPMIDDVDGRGCISRVRNNETDGLYQLLYPGSCVPRSKSCPLEPSLNHLNSNCLNQNGVEELTLFPFYSLSRVDDNREGNDSPACEPHGLQAAKCRRPDVTWRVGLKLDIYGYRTEYYVSGYEDERKRWVSIRGIYECARTL